MSSTYERTVDCRGCPDVTISVLHVQRDTVPQRVSGGCESRVARAVRVLHVLVEG